MDERSKTGGKQSSDIDSTASRTPKLDTSAEFRMLTPSELELLRRKQLEIREVGTIFRVVQEAQAAYLTWAHWEAINALLADSATQSAMEHFGYYSIDTIRMALARDSMLAAFRLSDQPSKDNVTLCSVAYWLNKNDNAARVSSKQWALDLGHKPYVAEAAALKNAKAVQDFQNYVLPKWPASGQLGPVNPELFELRSVLRDVRDTRLAHLLTRAPKVAPIYDQIRRLIDLTLTLATDMAFVLQGSAAEAENFKSVARDRANRFWSTALKAPVDAYQQHRALAGFADEVE